LEGHAEHHDVGVELGAQPLLAQLGQVLGKAVVGAAVGQDLVAQGLGVEVLAAE
jgi:hypothetical protein